MVEEKTSSFTIVIPVLNEEKYISNLLNDLSTQTFQNFEVVVVDASSEDKTVTLAKSFIKKLPFLKVINSKKRGVSYQRNLGAQNAKSPWIIFMDADNRLPNYFLEGVAYKIKLENPDAFTCWMQVNSDVMGDEIIAKVFNIGVEIQKVTKNPGAFGSMIGIKSTLFKKTGGFDGKVTPLEDWDFVTKVNKRGFKFKIFRDPKYYYSLRRIERAGHLNMFRSYAVVYLKLLLKSKVDLEKDYPMGGKINQKESSFFEKYRENIKKLIKKPKFLKKIRSLLQSLDSGY